jgi:acyl dehydratase
MSLASPQTQHVEVGQTLPPLTVRMTRATLVRYAGASGDFNPIHFSDHFATELGLPGVIAHGMLTMGSALRVVTDWIGDPARIRSYSVRFSSPVAVPDNADGVEVCYSATVTAVESNVVSIAIEAICDEKKVLGAARAEVDLGA